MPCVACFVLCPHFVFKFGFACRVVQVWVRIRLRQCVRCVFTKSLAPSLVCCCVAVGAPGCSTCLHIALRECFPCAWSVLFPTSWEVTCGRLFSCVLLSQLDEGPTIVQDPLERRKFDCERAAFTSVCCGDVHRCILCFS